MKNNFSLMKYWINFFLRILFFLTIPIILHSFFFSILLFYNKWLLFYFIYLFSIYVYIYRYIYIYSILKNEERKADNVIKANFLDQWPLNYLRPPEQVRKDNPLWTLQKQTERHSALKLSNGVNTLHNVQNPSLHLQSLFLHLKPSPPFPQSPLLPMPSLSHHLSKPFLPFSQGLVCIPFSPALLLQLRRFLCGRRRWWWP